MQPSSKYKLEKEPVYQQFLEFSRLAPSAYGDIAEAFQKSPSEYRSWLLDTTEKIFSYPEIKGALSELGIDWLTLHYKTRHPRKPWEREADWIQLSLPLASYMENRDLVDRLSVYGDEQSPYIENFSVFLSKKGQPLRIILGLEKSSDGWLVIRPELTDLLRDLTHGPKRQGSFLAGETKEAMALDPAGVEEISEKMGSWSGKEGGLDTNTALGMLRDACRVTLLALKEAPVLGIDELKVPRAVVLSPVAVGSNVIGGIAFIGIPRVNEFEASLLSLMSYSLLAGLRLREEERREIRTREIEQLNSAQSRFVQLAAHSIHSPLDALAANVGETSTWLQHVMDGAIRTQRALTIMSEAVDRARTAAAEIILTFARDDFAAYLRIKIKPVDLFEFMETLIFFHERAFVKHGLVIECAGIAKGTVVNIDENAFLEVFNNLLQNALRFAQSRVVIYYERLESHVFRVRNDGEPIPPDIRERLFQPGVHGESPYPERSKSSGQGFGLFLSKHIMDQHGGDLRINEQFMDGAEFIVVLPLEPPGEAV